MKVLLIGAGGQLGRDLRTVLPQLGRVVCTVRAAAAADGEEDLDVADIGAVEGLIDRCCPDIVVNAAAHTAVDRAEGEAEQAFRINADAPAAMARACMRRGARFVHYSTDYVFDGAARTPYSTDLPVAPQGVYGASKAAGEQRVRAELPDALVLRTAWVYAMHGQNFLRTMLRLASERDELRVVGDQTGTPTPTWLIAETTLRMLMQPERLAGTFHVVARGQTSWHGFAEAIVEEAYRRDLLSRRPAVVPISTSEFPTPARRPAYSVLDVSKVELAIGAPLPHWQAALHETFDRSVSRA